MRFNSKCFRALMLALLSAGCDEWTTSLERDPDEVPNEAIIDVTAAATSIAADGRSTVRLEARIPDNAPNRLVTFTSNAGRFVETGTATIQSAVVRTAQGQRLATTLLRSDTLGGTAIIRATAGEFYDTVSVAFIK